MAKKYTVKELTKNADRTALSEYSDILANMLLRRGINSPELAKNFLNPDYENGLHDPFLLSQMDIAVDRFLKAVENKERIAFYCDYDADGIPGAVMANDFFNRIKYDNFEIYIPDRHEEGFGLNTDAIDELAKRGTKLLITVDCGIADVKEVEHVKTHNMDVIITDHHEPGKILPDAFAIIDPKKEGDIYPDKNLCGSGVAYKFITAILAKNRFGLAPGEEKWFLDMVGMATLSDMVSLTGENRILSHFGLKVLRKSRRLGLQKLFRKIAISPENISEDDVGFSITPRINAASRMGVPMDAFRLLSAVDEAEADRLSAHLEKINNERKGVVASIVKEAKKHITEREKDGKKKVIVIGNPDWRPSLLGLVANSLAGHHNRPVFLWGRGGGGVIKGSCRSEGTSDVFKLMETARDAFIECGGHKMSGGFSVSHEKIHLLEDALNNAYTDKVLDLKEFEEVDFILNPEDVNYNLFNEISKLSPFGVGNPKPIFMIKDGEVSYVKEFGKAMEHIEVGIKSKKGKDLKAIGFFSAKADFEKDLSAGSKIDLVFHLEKSFFRNYPELRLRIVDIV